VSGCDMEWYVIALASAIFTGIASITEKKTLFKEHAMEYGAVFSLFAFILSIPFAFFADFSFPPQYWLVLAGVGVVDTIAFLYVTKAIRHMELSEASPLLTISPALAAIFAFLFLGEFLAPQRVVGVGLIIVGAYFLEFRNVKKKRKLLYPFRVMFTSKYIHYIAIGLLLYAVSGVVARYLLATSKTPMDKYAYLFLLHLFIALTFLVFIHAFHDGWRGIQHGVHRAGKWIFLTSLLLFSSRAFLIAALTIPTAKLALILAIKRLSSLFATVVGGEIFHDSHLPKKIIGCVIMVAGALLVVL